MGEAMAGDVGIDVGSASSEQRPYAITLSGRQDGESPNAGAAQDAHEYSLGPVVGMVAGGDAVGSHSARGLPQGLPPRAACASLEVAALGDSDARAPEGHIERVGKILCDIELGSALRTEAVVDSVGEKTKPSAAPDASQDVE
jgi:hypothetical protein